MKTIADVNQEVAEELGIPLKVIEQVNRAYWQEIRAEIENPDTDNVRVEGFGTFYISPKQTLRKVLSYHQKLRAAQEGKIDEKYVPKMIEYFKEFWAIKQKFKFRMTDRKEWNYVNMQVGYIKNYNPQILKTGAVQDEHEDDFDEVTTFKQHTNGTDIT